MEETSPLVDEKSANGNCQQRRLSHLKGSPQIAES
jgi:hypothetical protein